MPPAIRQRLEHDLRDARRSSGQPDEAWAFLEEAHILSQPWVWPHVRVHGAMLRLALDLRDPREVAGQIVRLVVAGPGSATGRYPLGNTGRARVGITTPMPMPDELAHMLETAP